MRRASRNQREPVQSIEGRSPSPSAGRLRSWAARAVLAAGALGLVGAAACGGDESAFGEPGGTVGSGGHGTGGDAVGGSAQGGMGGGGLGGGGGPVGETRGTIEGDATWTVTFDATAQAAGAVNCSYTRHYTGVEDRSAPWLCPACEVMYRVDVTLTSGATDCFPQVSDLPPQPVEWLGYAGGTWWRANGSLATEQGTAIVDAASVSYTNLVQDVEAPMGGTLQFDVAGEFTLGTEEGDPMNGWAAATTYTCGWPKSGAAEYGGGYTLTMGGVVPDGLFVDSCNDIVRLHDFAGMYLIFEMAAVDCPACDGMADDQEAFVTSMAGQGIPVHVITMLAPSLDDPLGDTSLHQLEAWKTQHGLSSPVLADRGWSLSMLIPVLADDTAYPGWIVVDPDLRVIDVGAGYGGFDEHEATILADAQ